MPPPNNRRCADCGGKYYRVNSMSMWTARSEGSRNGWFKDNRKLCNKCLSVGEARKIYGLCGIKLLKVA